MPVKKRKKATTKRTAKQPPAYYDRDGNLWAKGNIISGEPEGYWEWFRKDGTIVRSGTFKRGKQTGAWTTYDKKGGVYRVIYYK